MHILEFEFFSNQISLSSRVKRSLGLTMYRINMGPNILRSPSSTGQLKY